MGSLGRNHEHPVVFGAVDFQRPGGRRRSRFVAWIYAVYLLLFGVWAVAGSLHRHPVLGALAALIYLEFAVAAVRAGQFAGRVVYSDGLAQRVVSPLVDLCRKTGCPIPRVVLSDSVVRAAFVRRGKGRVNLVLSRRFIELVDARELRAILAHEIAHVARGDLRWVRVRVVLALVIGLAGGFGAAVVSTGQGISYPVYLAGFFLAAMLVQFPLALANRPMERRADAEGAGLIDDPAALASALATAYRFNQDARNLLYGPRPWRWLFFSPVSWTFPTHPPMEQRIAALRSVSPVTASSGRS